MLPDSEIAIRLVGATVIGALLGLDREARNKPAGLRTHALVSLGAALITMMGVEFGTMAGVFNADAVSRTIQGIIAGVGFLGGGAILKAKDSDDVRGLTTAATIWVVAALGVACGGGYWKAALLGLFLAVIALTLGRPVENVVRWFVHRRSRVSSPPPRPDED
jgi:putative Mg2+ transporter-C (MgtC) family protein